MPPLFVPISKHQEDVLFKIVEGRDQGLIDSDSFRVEQHPPGLVLDRQPITGSVQDLVVLSEAGYMSVSYQDPPGGQRVWHASLKEHGRAYYRWRHSKWLFRLAVTLRP